MSIDPKGEEDVAADARRLAEKARDWMLHVSFPFWAERSVDPAGGFYERLDLAGQGIPGEDSRVRLQARMAFTFALAADLGWDRGRALQLTQRAIDVLVNDCRRDDGLYGARVRPGEGLTVPTAETYDTAFALLAFATAYRVFRLEKALEAGQQVSKAIDQHLLRPEVEGGYRERLPAPEVREQNPHMHLTEALLAWYEATQDRSALERAQKLAGFVEDRFYRGDLGLLVETDIADDSANRVEAGHLFEWVWILGRLRELGGEHPAAFAKALHDGGMRLIENLDYLPLSQRLDGSVLEDVQRTWGPTEKLKGHISLWRAEPDAELPKMIVATAEKLFANHVDGALPGAWIDVIDAEGNAKVDDITPATGYHIFLALKELIDFSQALKTD